MISQLFAFIFSVAFMIIFSITDIHIFHSKLAYSLGYSAFIALLYELASRKTYLTVALTSIILFLTIYYYGAIINDTINHEYVIIVTTIIFSIIANNDDVLYAINRSRINPENIKGTSFLIIISSGSLYIFIMAIPKPFKLLCILFTTIITFIYKKRAKYYNTYNDIINNCLSIILAQ